MHQSWIKMVAISRDSLDKNGSYLEFTVMTDTTWAGVSSLSAGTIFTAPTWSPTLKKKFTPKPIRKGWRN